MDELEKIGASGGNDLYGAGTWSTTAAKVVTITLTSATSHAGATVAITVNGLTRTATFDTSIEITSTAFVTDNAADYASVGATLTGTTTLIFTGGADKDVEASLLTTHSDLTGTMVETGYRLPKPLYAFTVHAAAVISSFKHIKTGTSTAVPGYKRLFTQSLTENTLIFFQYPVTEIVIASGSVIGHHTK
jgi:hypothetical protein